PPVPPLGTGGHRRHRGHRILEPGCARFHRGDRSNGGGGGVPFRRRMTSDAPARTGSWVTRWGYLVFLAFVLVGPFLGSDEDVGTWVLEGAVILVTVALYVWRELTDTRGDRAVYF